MGHLGSGKRMRDNKKYVRSRCSEQGDLSEEEAGALDRLGEPQTACRSGLEEMRGSMQLGRQAKARLQKSLDSKM